LSGSTMGGPHRAQGSSARSLSTQARLFMAKTRVLYVSPNSLLGGGEINQMLLAANVDADSFEVEVAVCDEGPYAHELRRRGLPVAIVPMHPLRFRSRSAPSPRSVYRLLRHIRKVSADLVHSSSLPADHHSAIAARLAGVPVIHDVQTIIYRAMPVDRWRAANSARIICISHAIRRAMARAGLPVDNTEIIYSGVDPKTRECADGPRIREEFGLTGSDVIAIASRLSPEKGQENFLRAAALVEDRFPNARFLVAGGAIYAPHSYQAHLRQLATDLGLGGRVIFTGFRKDIADVIDAADVLVCAADEEALGRVVLEAMALAKPVIATKAGGPCETVEDGVTGLLVPPRDFESLARAMARLLSDTAAARRMGSMGRRRAACLYTLKQNTEKVQELYRQVLAERAKGSGK